MTYLYIAGIAVILAGAWIYRSRVAELDEPPSIRGPGCATPTAAG